MAVQRAFNTTVSRRHLVLCMLRPAPTNGVGILVAKKSCVLPQIRNDCTQPHPSDRHCSNNGGLEFLISAMSSIAGFYQSTLNCPSGSQLIRRHEQAVTYRLSLQ